MNSRLDAAREIVWILTPNVTIGSRDVAVRRILPVLLRLFCEAHAAGVERAIGAVCPECMSGEEPRRQPTYTDRDKPARWFHENGMICAAQAIRSRREDEWVGSTPADPTREALLNSQADSTTRASLSEDPAAPVEDSKAAPLACVHCGRLAEVSPHKHKYAWGATER